MQVTSKKNDHEDKISIGIPTYEAGQSLVAVVKSITTQTCYSQIDRILIAVDGNSIPKKILNSLTEKKVKIVYFKNRKGQSTRINDIFKLLNTKKIVLTNDDVILEKNALEFIQKKYKKYDLIAGNVKAFNEKKLFGQSLIVGQKFRESIAAYWNSGDNYLSCNGRLIVLSKKLYKRISIPEKIWNNDAYIYLMSKELRLKFTSAQELIAYYKSPSTIKEHLSQSNKFQKSTIDLQRYFKRNISSYYRIPISAIIKSLVLNSLKNPYLTFVYLLIFSTTRLKAYFSHADFWFQSFWETDPSTKTVTNI